MHNRSRHECRSLPHLRARVAAAVLVLALVLLGCTVIGFDTPYNKGIEAYRNGKLNEAAEQFRIATEQDPTFAEAWYNLARTYDELALSARDRLAELESLRQSSEQPDAGDVAALRAQIAQWRHLAEEAYLRAIDTRPTYAEARVCLAMFLYDEGDGDAARARALLEQATTADRGVLDRAFPEAALGYLLFLEGELEAAEAAYRRALRIEPDSALAYYRLGQLYHARAERALLGGEPGETPTVATWRAHAIEAYRESVSNDGGDWVARAALGRELLTASREQENETFLREAATALALAAAEADGADFDLILDTASTFVALGYYEQALPWLYDARAMLPPSIESLRLADAQTQARFRTVQQLLLECHRNLADTADDETRRLNGDTQSRTPVDTQPNTSPVEEDNEEAVSPTGDE